MNTIPDLIPLHDNGPGLHTMLGVEIREAAREDSQPSTLQKQQLQLLQDQEITKRDKKHSPSRFWGQFLVQVIPQSGMSALNFHSLIH